MNVVSRMHNRTTSNTLEGKLPSSMVMRRRAGEQAGETRPFYDRVDGWMDGWTRLKPGPAEGVGEDGEQRVSPST